MAPSRALFRLGTASCRLTSLSSLHHPYARFSTLPVTLLLTRSTNSRTFSCTSTPRTPSLQAPTTLDESEGKIFHKLNAALEPDSLTVQDVSGGCGSMYALDIISAKFAGLSVIKQHKLVNQILADEIKGWHGVQLKTKAP